MRLLVAVLVVLASARALAGGYVGVVTGGDAGLQRELEAYVAAWIRDEGDKIVRTPFSRDATNTLVNCFVIEDLTCARGVFETRARSFSLVYIGADKQGDGIAFTVYWFAKGQDPVGEKQTCPSCQGQAWHPLVGTMLSRVSGRAKTGLGKLELTSDPPGFGVVLDDVKAGATPVARDLPAGKHTITLTNAGKPVASRDIDIRGGETTTVLMKVDLDTGGKQHSRTGPIVLIAAGGAATIGGGVMVYVGSLAGARHKWIYPAMVPAGIALCAVGGGAVVTGTVLLLRAGRSAPVAAVTRNSAYLGWAGQF